MPTNSAVVVELSSDEKVHSVFFTLLPYGIILFDLFIVAAAIYGIVAFLKNRKAKREK